MSTTGSAKARRRSARNNYRDMAPQKRPHYRKSPRKNAGKKAAAAKARGWKG